MFSGTLEVNSKKTFLSRAGERLLEEQTTSLTGLQPASTYVIRVAILNAKGVGPFSKSWEEDTLEGG